MFARVWLFAETAKPHLGCHRGFVYFVIHLKASSVCICVQISCNNDLCYLKRLKLCEVKQEIQDRDEFDDLRVIKNPSRSRPESFPRY